MAPGGMLGATRAFAASGREDDLPKLGQSLVEMNASAYPALTTRRMSGVRRFRIARKSGWEKATQPAVGP